MKINSIFVSVMIIYSTFFSCKHEPVKKEKPSKYEGIKKHDFSSKDKDTDKQKRIRKKEKIPDVPFEELEGRDDKSDWVSPIKIDYKIYERGAPVRLVVQGRHSDYIRDVAVSPDGKLIVTASADRSVKIWDINGVLLNTLPLPDKLLYRIKITPDGKRIVAALKKMIIVWRIDGKLLKSYKGKEYDVRRMDIRSDGRSIITASDRRYFELRDRNFRVKRRIKTGSYIYSVAFSPDGRYFATGGSYYRNRDGWVSASALWSSKGDYIRDLDLVKPTAMGRNRRKSKEKPTGEVRWIAFSPDGKLIATVGKKHILNIRKINGELLHNIKFVFIRSCYFTHNSREVIVSGSHDMKIFRIDGREKLSFHMRSAKERGNVVSNFHMRPDGRRIVTGFSSPRGGLVRIWDYRGKLLATLGKSSMEIQRILISPDNRRLILEPNRRKNRTLLWDIKGENISEIDERIGFYTDGGEYRFYYGNYNEFHISGKKGKGVFKTRYGGGVIPLPDGRIARWSQGAVVLHDVKGNPLRRFSFRYRGNSGIGGPYSYGTEFSPDGSYFLLEGNRYHGGVHSISLIDMNGKKLRNFRVGTDLSTAAVSSGGKFIATGHKSGLIQIWTRTGKPVKKLKGHAVEIKSLYFSKNRGYILSTSADRTIRIWNIKSGTFLNLLYYENGEWIVIGTNRKFETSQGGRNYIKFVKGLTVLDDKKGKWSYKSGLISDFIR